ncbi:IS21-like element helper ATPase IstB [Thiorhodovibrio frisius]|uniref:IS21-like element helper ATPase IstB n=1 Tax=Thiorhodovibrio frisius TaxID=631362 RepID=UPI002B25CB57|nr:IS21-like element helper ATPase IstB [Thiorhodovibrio frisius]WPL23652.1 transposase [Thiorhodovibrio frisius]
MVQTATLPLMLKQLRLSSIAQHWQGFLDHAQRHGWDSAQYLSALCEQELADRDSRRIARYSKDARLPVGKSLASFDFAQVPGLAREQIEALAGSADWTRQARNLLLFGPSGVGKTHLAAAIGHGLTVQGVRVRYLATTALVQQLQLARTQLHLEDALHKLERYAVLILDDFGYVKKSETETQVLFELIAHRYETASLIITSNQPFAEWDRIFPDQMMTVAAVDRLVHHATIIDLSSDSYRRKQALGQIAAEPGSLTPTPAPTITLPSPSTTTSVGCRDDDSESAPSG